MVQFDPQLVAQMLMQPIQRASENLGGGPFGIGADAGGSYFVDPEVAARTGYGTAVTGTSFFPGAGIVDAYGGAVDITGQPLPSFSENIGQGNYLDAALQGLGVAGDVATVAAPLTLGTSAVLGAMLKAPRAAQKSSAIFNSVERFPSLSKSEESLVAASSAPDEEIAGLGKVVVEKIDPNDLEGSRKRFKELKDLTANYKQDRAKARLIKLDTGEDAIQYMQPPTEVTTLNISDLTATQSDVVLGGDASLSDTMPLVVKKEGKFFIRDGHHRLAQKAISGESSAEVRLVDLDKGADVASDVADSFKPGSSLFRYERKDIKSPNTGAVFYSPDKTYAELYKSEDSVLRETKIPENFLDIQKSEDQGKAISWISTELDRLEKLSDNAEISGVRSDISLARQQIANGDAQGISSALANLNLIYGKENNTVFTVGMAEKKLMQGLNVDAMSIKEAGRDVDEFSIAFKNNPEVASDVGSITRSSTLNEKGFDTDLVLYHGSSKPLKSVNDQRGLYLSPSSDVANYYTNPSYSAAAKSAGDFEEPAPNITPVHIKTEQIFDTRKPEHRKIFEEKFLNSYGNQTGIGEKGLPDWTDGEDFKEFFENENLPFKGVILDEGGFLDEGGEVVDRGVSYAIFDKDSVTPVLSDFDNVEVTPPTETQPGIIAFHGSGADFDEFRLDKIGTGEGAQAFGYGLYFADTEDIANFYKRQLTGSSFITKDGKIFDPYTMDIDGQPIIKNPNIRTSIADSDGDIDKPIARAERIIANSPNTEASELAEKDLVILKDLKAKGGFTVNKGKTYKVGIQPKADELLDYDKSIAEQSKKVQDALYKNEKIAELLKRRQKEDGLPPEFYAGSQFYDDLSEIMKNDENASKLLNDVGIKGIKFKSGQLSGIKDSEATNFVIFDDKLIKILEKYGIVGPVAVSATAAALRDDDGST